MTTYTADRTDTATLPCPRTPIRLAVIVGSTREGRFGPTVANWFAGQAAQRDDMSVDVIDLADTPLPDRASPTAPGPEDAEALAGRAPRAGRGRRVRRRHARVQPQLPRLR